LKKLLIVLLVFSATSAFASGGLSCFSANKKLRFDVVEASDRKPVSVKLYYKTDAINGENGAVQSFDLRNSKSEKVINYTESSDELVVVIQKDSSVVSVKINKESSKGIAQAMILDEVKTLKVSCVRE
jgi:hypothetical protein